MEKTKGQQLMSLVMSWIHEVKYAEVLKACPKDISPTWEAFAVELMAFTAVQQVIQKKLSAERN